jgi:hypothetical protein
MSKAEVEVRTIQAERVAGSEVDEAEVGPEVVLGVDFRVEIEGRGEVQVQVEVEPKRGMWGMAR